MRHFDDIDPDREPMFEEDPHAPCPECGGDGEVTVGVITSYGYSDPQLERTEPCPACDGPDLARDVEVGGPPPFDKAPAFVSTSDDVPF